MNCPYCDSECEETEIKNEIVYFCIPCRQDFILGKTGLEDRTSLEFVTPMPIPLLVTNTYKKIVSQYY